MESTEEQLGTTQGATDDSSRDSKTEFSYDEMVALYDESMRHLTEGEIVSGTVIDITSNDVVIDVGYKSEGLIPLQEFTSYDGVVNVAVGDDVEVLLERAEDSEGHVLLSKRKAERLKVWSEIEKSYQAGETIKGRVIDRIKGGLTVDVGIRAFLPGSLVDIRADQAASSPSRARELEFKVISLDRRRNNVVLSRKAVPREGVRRARRRRPCTRLREGSPPAGCGQEHHRLRRLRRPRWNRRPAPHHRHLLGSGESPLRALRRRRRDRGRGSQVRSRRPSGSRWATSSVVRIPGVLVDKKYPLGSQRARARW